MEKLTKQQAIEEHRKMWRWIAEQTEKQKEVVRKDEYLDLYYPNIKLKNNCFCCEYGTQKMIKNPCAKCPIDWNSEYYEYMCLNKVEYDDSLYSLWHNLPDDEWEEGAKLARQIVELPESKEEE